MNMTRALAGLSVRRRSVVSYASRTLGGTHCAQGRMSDYDLVVRGGTVVTAMEVTGWPAAAVLRGRVVMQDGHVQARPGSGECLPRGPYELIRPLSRLANGSDASRHA